MLIVCFWYFVALGPAAGRNDYSTYDVDLVQTEVFEITSNCIKYDVGSTNHCVSPTFITNALTRGGEYVCE